MKEYEVRVWPIAGQQKGRPDLERPLWAQCNLSGVKGIVVGRPIPTEPAPAGDLLFLPIQQRI